MSVSNHQPVYHCGFSTVFCVIDALPFSRLTILGWVMEKTHRISWLGSWELPHGLHRNQQRQLTSNGATTMQDRPFRWNKAPAPAGKTLVSAIFHIETWVSCGGPVCSEWPVKIMRNYNSFTNRNKSHDIAECSQSKLLAKGENFD